MPTLTTSVETTWSTAATPKTTPSLDAVSGNLLIACLVSGATNFDTVLAVSNNGTALTWVVAESHQFTTYCGITMWSCVLTEDRAGLTTSFAVSGTGTAPKFGGTLMCFTDHNGTGASNSADNTTQAARTNISLTADDSMVLIAIGDVSAADGSGRVWRTTAGALTEQLYFLSSGSYAVYIGYHVDAGTAATYTVGLTAPVQQYTIAALEIPAYLPPPTPEQTDLIKLTNAR